jgi:hypothetical protein
MLIISAVRLSYNRAVFVITMMDMLSLQLEVQRITEEIDGVAQSIAYFLI